MKVEPQEIVFIKENSPTGFAGLIKTYLGARGVKKNRTAIHTEISTIKASYDPIVIEAARELLKTVQKVEYN